jgi:carbon-nitrogen hydrolase
MTDTPKAFRVGLVQMCAGRDVAKNIAAAEELIREAARGGAQYVQTPEMTNIMELERARLLAAIQPEARDQGLTQLRFLARELGIWLHIGSLALMGDHGRPVNRSLLISPEGAIAARYDKIHMFDVDLGNGESYRESTNYEPRGGSRQAAVGPARHDYLLRPAFPAPLSRPGAGWRALSRRASSIYQADRFSALAHAPPRSRHRVPVLCLRRRTRRQARKWPRDIRP